MKIAHIHSDIKFINSTNRFISDTIYNEVFFIGEHFIHDITKLLKVNFIAPNKVSLKAVPSLLYDFDFVVVYCLDYYKIKIINFLPKKANILWVFFGYELYSKKQHLFHSQNTLSIIKQTKLPSKKANLFSNIRKMLFNIKGMYNYYKAVHKISHILVLSEIEYNFLKSHWKIPKFIKFPINASLYLHNVNFNFNTNQIIIGNSKSTYNNHIDVINKIQTLPNFSKINFLFFFNYGHNERYADYIKNNVKNYRNVKIIENYMSIDEFEAVYMNASALVINSYRQFAMANIFTAIKYGLKIYLNEKNTVKKWLEQEGFLVFSVDDLENDIQNNNYNINLEQKLLNKSKLEQLIYTNNTTTFQQEILNISTSLKK